MQFLKSYDDNQARAFSAQYEDAGEKEPIMVAGVSPLSVAVFPSNVNVNGKVQYTYSASDDVHAGNAAWLDWPLGAVSADASDVLLYPVAAVRLVVGGNDNVPIKFSVWGDI